jgi:N-acetyl-alpha-D-glucosaminyl L-malate synthase BshA
MFHLVHEKIPSKLLLIGDGPERRKAEDMCREYNLCHDVRFLGKQDAVEELLAISDLFIIPSENESFGLAALEAMACEVPVISSNAGGLPELNLHGKTGFVTEIGDVQSMAEYAISLLSNEKLHQEFRTNAYNRAKEFDIQVILPKYESYYKTVLERSVYKHTVD